MTVLMYPNQVLSRTIAASQLEMDSDEMNALAVLTDVLFFASLAVEEGDPVRLALVYHKYGATGLAGVYDGDPAEEPPLAWDVTPFGPKPLDAALLAKFSRGLEYGTQLVVVGGHIGDGGGLTIEGTARRRSNTDGGHVVRLAAPRAGVIAIERAYNEIWRFEAGQHVPSALDVIGEEGPIRSAISGITQGLDLKWVSFPANATIRRLIRRMRRTCAGGILAIMPKNPCDNILQRVVYRYADPGLLSSRIRDYWNKESAVVNELLRNAEKDVRDTSEVWERDSLREAADEASERLETTIDGIAQLSAIDGAVLAGPGLAIYGAGYKIPTPRDRVEVVRALDIAMKHTEQYDMRQHGTRHWAAVSFAYDNPNGIAFVISEDGPIKCALRIENHVAIWPVHVSET
jgi:hypothetical protein